MMRLLIVLTFLIYLVLGLPSLAMTDPHGLCRKQLENSLPSFSYEIAATLGSGEVLYKSGLAVQTNRRLLRFDTRFSLGTLKADEKFREMRLERSNPVQFPPQSISKLTLRQQTNGYILVSIVEWWDLLQGTPFGGFLGMGGFAFRHDLPFELVDGSWTDYLNGKLVRLRTTKLGAQKAAYDFQVLIGLSSIHKQASLKNAEIDMISEADLVDAMFSITSNLANRGNFEIRDQAGLVRASLDFAKQLHDDPSKKYTIHSATPVLHIEIEGVKNNLIVRYLNDVTAQSLGLFYESGGPEK